MPNECIAFGGSNADADEKLRGKVRCYNIFDKIQTFYAGIGNKN